MPSTRTFTHEQLEERRARKNYVNGHTSSILQFWKAHSQNNRRNSTHSFLSKYYSTPSWESSDESSDSDSSNNDSHLDFSTVHLAHANQHAVSNLSQLTEDSYPQFDVHQNRRLHLRQQSLANELEGENQGGGRQHGTGE